MKADGRGLSFPLPEVSFSKPVAYLAGRPWYTKSLQLFEGYSVSIASSIPIQEKILVHEIDMYGLF